MTAPTIKLGLVLAAVALTGCNLVLETTNNHYGTGGSAGAPVDGGGGTALATGGGGIGGAEEGGGGTGTGTGSGGGVCGGAPNDAVGACVAASCCGSTTCTSLDTTVGFGELCDDGASTEDLDEAFDAGALSRWAVKYWDECNSDVALCDNSLVVTPAGHEDHWFDNEPGIGKRAPMAYRRLCGSFMIATQVSTTPSAGSFNGVGLAMVHPATDYVWTLLSHGNQDPAPSGPVSLGTKLYPTLPDGAGDASTNNNSMLGGVYNSVNSSATLAACRLPDRTFLFYRIETGSTQLDSVTEGKGTPFDDTYGMDDSACVDAGLTAHYFTFDAIDDHHGAHDEVVIRGGIEDKDACEAAILDAFSGD